MKVITAITGIYPNPKQMEVVVIAEIISFVIGYWTGWFLMNRIMNRFKDGGDETPIS